MPEISQQFRDHIISLGVDLCLYEPIETLTLTYNISQKPVVCINGRIIPTIHNRLDDIELSSEEIKWCAQSAEVLNILADLHLERYTKRFTGAVDWDTHNTRSKQLRAHANQLTKRKES